MGRQLAAAFLFGEKYSAYGVIGAMIVIMLWIYGGCAVLLLGAEFARIAGQDGEPPKP